MRGRGGNHLYLASFVGVGRGDHALQPTHRCPVEEKPTTDQLRRTLAPEDELLFQRRRLDLVAARHRILQ